MLTIPLRASGRGSEGRAFERDATTVSINRYGARIRLPEALVAGQTLHLQNLANQLSSDFRVVGFVGEAETGGAEWGVEILNPDIDFWGIYFPPSSPEQPQSAALLECGVCHTVGLLPVSLSEVETLDASAMIAKFCAQCRSATDWRYPLKPAADPSRVRAQGEGPSSSVGNGEAEDSGGLAAREAPQLRLGSAEQSTALAPPEVSRREPRHYVRRQITIRDSLGRAEVTQTENLSKTGVCLTSEFDYATGQDVTLIWPHPASGRTYHARARVVRRHDIGGTVRKIYGLEYLGAPALVAPPPRSARALYVGLAGLIAATAALLALGVFHLGVIVSVPTRAGTALVELGVSVLLLYAGHRICQAIVKREFRDGEPRVQRLRIMQAISGVVLAVAVGAGGWLGVQEGRGRLDALRLVNDLSMSDAIERSIDQTEALDTGTSQNADDAAARLETLSAEWQRVLERVAADMAQRDSASLANGEQANRIDVVFRLLSLDREKLALVHAQIATLRAATRFAGDQQYAAREQTLRALRRQMMRLNQERGHLLQSLPRQSSP
jgi:hypothetical protein